MVSPHLLRPCGSSKGLNIDLELKGQANVLCCTQLLLDRPCAVQRSCNLHGAQVNAGVRPIFGGWSMQTC